MNEHLKVPPMSIEAEQAVLGGLMLDNSALDYVLDACDEADFYNREHRMIFRAIIACDDAGIPFDPISLADALDKSKELENIGGLQRLGSMVANTPSASNIKTYAKAVRDKSLERQLAQSANKISDLVYDGSMTPHEKIDAAGALLMELTDDRTTTGPIRVSGGMAKWLSELDARFERGGEIVGISTGYSDIDTITAGLHPADLVIIAGRPSMGKTTLAMNIAEHVASVEGVPVAVFSLEMQTTQLINRMISSTGRIKHQNIRSGKLAEDEWQRVSNAAAIINKAPLFIDDTAGISTAELRSRSRRLAKQEGIGLIVVDYLQLMRHKGSENRLQEISEISRSLKSVAKELNVPVIALSQLSRAVDSRTNKRPVMSDLRESGSIEQDADVVAFVYRDEVYNEDSPDKGTAEIILRKQRNGEIGTVRMAFNGSLSRFDTLGMPYKQN